MEELRGVEDLPPEELEEFTEDLFDPAFPRLAAVYGKWRIDPASGNTYYNLFPLEARKQVKRKRWEVHHQKQFKIPFLKRKKPKPAPTGFRWAPIQKEGPPGSDNVRWPARVASQGGQFSEKEQQESIERLKRYFERTYK